MNHKRKRPKNRRAGCLMCKPWKGNGMKHRNMSAWGGSPAPIKERIALDEMAAPSDGECCLGCVGDHDLTEQLDRGTDCECYDEHVCPSCAAMGDGKPLRVSLLEAL